MIYKDIAQFKQEIKTRGQIMAIDYGQKKTGIAISDFSAIIAMPLCVISAQGPEIVLNKIEKLLDSYSIAFFVLGFPHSQYNSKVYDAFAQQLLSKFNKPIYLQDEGYTSRLAHELLYDIGFKGKKRYQMDDNISAKLILERFLDSYS